MTNIQPEVLARRTPNHELDTAASNASGKPLEFKLTRNSITFGAHPTRFSAIRLLVLVFFMK